MNLSNISLNYYSFGFYGGLISYPGRSEPMLELDGLLTLTQKYNLGGIEIPFDRFYDLNKIDHGIEVLKKIIDKGLSVFIDLESFDINYISNLVPKLSGIGIKTIRVKMDQIESTIYGGNRYLSPTFDSSIDQFKHKIFKLMPVLDEFDIALAIENHQDFHSLELLEISNSFNSDLIGITWDVGNSIAVGDTIDSFFDNAGHLIKNVHLKDYKVFKSSKGIRLVRCPLGEGVVDYAKLFSKLITFDVNMSIELGAQISRECDINESDYWKGLSGIDLNQKDYLEFIDKVAVTSLKSLSKYEEGLSGSELIRSELKDFEISVENFKKIFLEMSDE